MTDHSDDAEVVEVPAPGATMIPAPAPAAVLAVTPQVEATELVARLDTIRKAQETAMVEGVDYGVIPGTKKPTLLKPGAEKLSVLFQLDVQLANTKTWGPGDHLTVESKATVFHAPTGARLGYGEGVCTTRERKYAYRTRKRACPSCGAEAILLSRDSSEGWFCWVKRGGCGAKFARDDQRLTSQTEEEIENPDLPDAWNTVVKMGEKRARVDAVLAVTGASALFTQDVEDQAPDERAEDRRPPKPSDAQLKLIGRLLGDLGASGDDTAAARAYGAEHFTGGQGGTASQTIELLKGTDAADMARKLVEAAREWQAKRSGVAADAEGRPG
jgi:ribosomal protein L37AE/L43A